MSNKLNIRPLEYTEETFMKDIFLGDPKGSPDGVNIAATVNAIINQAGTGEGKEYTAGNGINISGNEISAKVDNSTIVFQNGALKANGLKTVQGKTNGAVTVTTNNNEAVISANVDNTTIKINENNQLIATTGGSSPVKEVTEGNGLSLNSGTLSMSKAEPSTPASKSGKIGAVSVIPQNGLKLTDGYISIDPATSGTLGTSYVKHVYADKGLKHSISATGDVSISANVDNTTIKINENNQLIATTGGSSPVKEVTEGNGLSLNSGTLSMSLGSDSTAGAVSVIPQNGLKITDGHISIDQATSEVPGTSYVKHVSTDKGLKHSISATGDVSISANVDDATIKINENNQLVATTGGSSPVKEVTEGNGLSLDSGTLSMSLGSDSTAGAVKVSAQNGLTISSGTIGMSLGSNTTPGAVKVNAQNGLTISSGTIGMNKANGTTAGASTCDYTSTEKTKVSNLPTGTYTKKKLSELKLGDYILLIS